MPFNGYATPVATMAWRVPESLDPHRKMPTISPFSGAVPQGLGYELVTTGYDVEWSGDGTVGRVKPPFTLLCDAEQYARNWNDQRVLSYLDVRRIPPELPLMAPLSPEISKRYRAARDLLKPC